MHLSNVEIFGFKSFAKKVSITLHQGITAVVGPNGCGKTNVVDAIRWVLGEQKASVLRSDRMENVIFNGSAHKKPLGMAEVSLVLDNSKKILPIDYNEVLVTRRVFRSGESEYLLNKTPCRLKDITDLFADTGVGPDAYSVIELKMVESIISDRSEERRRLFEEAAGITKFKSRRQIALRRLEETNQDLLRVDDLISEVERNVNSLKRQVKKAERYNSYLESLKAKEREINTFQWALIRHQRTPLISKKANLSDEEVSYLTTIAQNETIVESLRQELQEWETQWNTSHTEYNTLMEHLNKEHMALSLGQERIRFLTEQMEKIRQENANLTLQAAQNQVLLDETTQNLAVVKNRREDEARKVQDAENNLQEFYLEFNHKKNQVEAAQKDVIEVIQVYAEKERVKDRIESEIQEKQRQNKRLDDEMQQIENRLFERNQHKTVLETELYKLRGDIDRQAIMVETLEGQKEHAEEELSMIRDQMLRQKHTIQNLGNQVSFLENFSNEGTETPEGEKLLLSLRESIDGLIGSVEEILHIDERYRRPIMTVLGKRSRYLVFDTAGHALQAMSILREKRGGKAAMIPLDLVSRKNITPDSSLLTGDVRIIGRATDFVTCDRQFLPLADILLFNTFIVNTDLSEWLISLNNQSPQSNVVDLQGNMIDLNGWLFGGDGEYVPGSLFDKEKELERLHQEIQEGEENLLAMETEKMEIERRVQEFTQSLTDAIAIQKKLNTRREEVERQYAVLDNDLLKDREFVTRMKKEKAQISLFSEQEEKLSSIQVEVQTMLDRRSQAEQRMEELRRVSAELEQERNAREHEYQNIRMTLLRTDEEIKRLNASIMQYEQNIKEIQHRQEEGQNLLVQYQTEKEQLGKENETINDELTNLLQEKSQKDEVLENIQNQQSSIKSRITELEQQIRQNRTKRESTDQVLHEIDITLAHLEEEEKVLLEKLGSKPEIDSTTWNGTEEELMNLKNEAEDLRKQLEAFGQLNFAALEEYQAEKTRFDTLLQQRSDIVEAEKTLQETITKINITARELFSTTFEKIHENFKENYKLFFEEGEADLILTGEDPLESRIDIVARPSGKRMQLISLLSAGEKALTAIALLLAIYKVKPSPFCILDEVDAPLDDANIDRFISAIRLFSRSTQFIIVTHNKRSMEAASYIYGVTMEEDGVSKLVSVRLE